MQPVTMTRGILALPPLVAVPLTLPLGATPPAAQAQTGAQPSAPTSASLVKKPAAPKAKSYAKPKVEKKVEKSKGAVEERDWTVMYYLDADCNLEAPMLDDIDDPDDLARLREILAASPHLAPHTAALLMKVGAPL